MKLQVFIFVALLVFTSCNHSSQSNSAANEEIKVENRIVTTAEVKDKSFNELF